MKLPVILGTIALGVAAICCQRSNEASVSTKTNEARQLVMDSIEAHGGKDRLYGNGQLQFRWTYHMSDKGPEAVLDTVQTVDPKTMAVVHEVIGKDIRFGMNKGEFWIQPKDAEFTSPPRFGALTPFYFIGMPFVFNDANANFQMLPEKMEFGGKSYT